MQAGKNLKPNRFYIGRDAFAACFLVLLVFILAFLTLDSSCYWGDDFAAYISQGIAMAEGRLEQQAALNLSLHPSPLPDEAIAGDELVYVWGYPLILSFIYRLVGFDRVNFDSIIFYKLPSLAALALLTAVLFYLYRRRFGFRLSFVLALVFCCCTEMFDFLNTVYSDMVFLMMAMLSLLLCEIFIEKRKSFLAVLLGICLWFMYEVRLNGVSILLCCILAQLIAVVSGKEHRNRTELLKQLVPYAVFVVLVFVSEALIARATPNTSDLGSGISIALFIENIKGYFRLICHWFGLLWNSVLINPLYSVLRRIVPLSFDSFAPLRQLFVGASLILCAVGMIFSGKGKNLHLSLLIVVYIIITSSLPYTQGLRYIYPLLPLILMFAGCGFSRLTVLFQKLPPRIYEAGCWFLLCFCCVFAIYPHISTVLDGTKGVRELDEISSPSDIYMQNAYSDEAIELYRYVQAETEEDCRIAFFAPRALYLNTQRLSLRPGVNGHSIDECDYYIQYLSVGDYPVDQAPEEGFSPCFENYEFILYRKLDQ